MLRVAAGQQVGQQIEHFVFVTGRNKGAIEDYFDLAFELETNLREKASKADILAEVEKTRLPAGGASTHVLNFPYRRSLMLYAFCVLLFYVR